MAENKQDGNKRFQKSQNHPQTILNAQRAEKIIAKVMEEKEAAQAKKDVEESPK